MPVTAGQRKPPGTVRAALRYALDLLAPERCLFCDQLSDRDLSLCDSCEAALRPNDGACPHCALPDCGGALCPPCLASTGNLPTILAPYVYDPMIAHLMHAWKYNRERRLARTAARLLESTAAAIDAVDMVLPTPLHWRRHLHRGFNQSQDLLDELQRLSVLELPHRRSAIHLRRTHKQKPQAHATRRDRQRQVADLFEASGPLRGESILLIDDVCTTGATAAAMTRALTNAGAGSVRLLCLARTPAHSLTG